jgi:hypothetical protein
VYINIGRHSQSVAASAQHRLQLLLLQLAAGWWDNVSSWRAVQEASNPRLRHAQLDLLRSAFVQELEILKTYIQSG